MQCQQKNFYKILFPWWKNCHKDKWKNYKELIKIIQQLHYDLQKMI